MKDWYFRGFCDELSPRLKYVQPLPQMPSYYMAQKSAGFQPGWPIGVNVEHILGDTENLERIPAKVRKSRNLPLLFDIVNIGLHFFLKNVRPMLPPVTKHSTAVV